MCKKESIWVQLQSSGNSTGPHLHFQINYLYEDDPDGDFTGYNQDAMVGACNDGSYFAAFEEQPPYDDPAGTDPGDTFLFARAL